MKKTLEHFLSSFKKFLVENYQGNNENYKLSFFLLLLLYPTTNSLSPYLVSQFFGRFFLAFQGL